MLRRRDTLIGALALAACAPKTITQRSWTPPPDEPRFAAIEQRIGGRVGVAAFNTGTGDWLGRRLQERFAMCSTFKWLLAANALHIDQQNPGFRNQRMGFGEADLLAYAPVARQLLQRGWMTVEEACAAAVVMSDNTAANLLLTSAASPERLTLFLRANGDRQTRLDRLEPDLNENLPGDVRDTTTPEAMARTMQSFLLTDTVLNAPSREALIGWLIASPTGLQRLRAGFPLDWRVGDKTGTSEGAHNAANDVAIAWPPGRAPIIVACYLSHSSATPAERNAAHAEIARVVAEAWG